ncbi:MAG: Ig-like domain-containing protein [Bacteroidales bacterium]|jgi:hypothetical protein|nr:Ig-like domain-containing protein [Bacteroidales bacterium]
MEKIKKISDNVGIFLLVALLGVTYGCVEYDKLDITEKPYVDKTSVVIYIGEGVGDHNQAQLKSSPEGKQYTWTSLDPSVATVTQTGLVTAVSEGFAVISVTSSSDQTNVNVWVRNWIPFEDFTLDKQQVEVKRLDKVQIVATPVPQNASEADIRWTSSDPAVATVLDNGWIMGNEIGSAIITASAAGKEYQVEVEVVPAIARFTINAANIPGYTASNAGTIGYSSQHGGYTILNLFDGNITTFWHTNYSAPASDFPHWFIVDLRRSVIVTEVMLQRRQGNFPSANGFYLYTCPDVTVDQNDPVNGYPWEMQGDYTFNPDINDEQRYVMPDALTARYIKVYFDVKHKDGRSPYAQFAEFGIYGY